MPLRILLLLSCLFISVQAEAQGLNKCKDSTGKTVYTDAHCPSGTTNQQMEWTPSANTNVIDSGARTGIVKTPLPNFSAQSSAERLVKVQKALTEVEIAAAQCKMAFAHPSSEHATQQCGDFDKKVHWLQAVVEALADIANKDRDFAQQNRTTFVGLTSKVQEMRGVLVNRIALGKRRIGDLGR